MKPLFILLFLSVFVLSCDTEEIPFIDDSPIVANAEGAYSYTVIATSYTNNRTDRLNFQGGEVQLSLTLTGFNSGSGQMVITSADGTIIRQELLDGNKVVTEPKLSAEDIESISLAFNDFSGTLVIALSDGD